MEISKKSLAFILIVSIIIVTFSFKAYSEPKENYIISDKTLLTVKDINKKFGKVTALARNNELLLKDEIEIDGEKYKLEIDIDSELLKGNEVAIYFKEENNEKFIKYIQIISETIPESPIAVLSSLNILKGDENRNLKLDETITRAEYAVLINRILGVQESAKYAVRDNVFSDVSDKHWACGHINVACDMNIMHGYGDGNCEREYWIVLLFRYRQHTCCYVFN